MFIVVVSSSRLNIMSSTTSDMCGRWASGLVPVSFLSILCGESIRLTGLDGGRGMGMDVIGRLSTPVDPRGLWTTGPNLLATTTENMVPVSWHV